MCFLLYLPSFLVMLDQATSADDPILVRKMLAKQGSGSLYPNDTKIAVVMGNFDMFEINYANYAPYFEEWVFLSLAMVSLVSPCITIYYVLPYRKRVTSILMPFTIEEENSGLAEIF
ncbi:unnamed protein product, partial [Mesorhabditis spiculigera]